MNRIRWSIAVAAAILAACRDHPLEIVHTSPTFASATVASNANNVLSAIVSVRTAHAENVTVRFHSAIDQAVVEETPAVAAVGDAAVIPVFGLLPDHRYVLRAVAHGPGGDVASAPLELTTGALPSLIPRYSAGGTRPTPGYIAFSVGGYGIVIDNSGRVVWYHHRSASPFLNFQPQRTGRYIAGASAADPGGPFTEIDPLGNITRSLDCAGDVVPRFHDLIAKADGSYWLMCDEIRTMDLTSIGGLADARVTGTVAQHVSAAGERLFHWSSFDHFSLTDLEASARTGPIVNWTHGNAIDIAPDGNLLISFRSLNELTKIDTRTGDVLWRMGGSRSDFTFDGAVEPPYARQHGLRSASATSFAILDNLGSVETSRGERYEYDEHTHTARLTTSYVPSVAVLALLGGNTQQLPGGHVLVSYGSGGRVEEYDAEGRVVWQILGNAGYVFRATRITSLYNPVPY